MWRKVPWPLCTPAPNGRAELDRARTADVTEEESKGTKPSSSYLGTNSLTIDVAGAISMFWKSIKKHHAYPRAHWSLLYSPDPTKKKKRRGRGGKNFVVTTFLFKRSQPSSLGIRCAPHAFAYQSLTRQRWLTHCKLDPPYVLSIPHILSALSPKSRILPPSLPP